MRAILIGLLLLFATAAMSVAQADELPVFATDMAADKWLRENSDYYRMMAASVDARSGYSIWRADLPFVGNVCTEAGKLVIELDNTLTGDKRVSVLIFEMTNAYQAPRHQDIDQGVRDTRITSPQEFGRLHELVEFDGLRHQRVVFEELDSRLQGVPAEMLQWQGSTATRLSEYELPLVDDYLKAQQASGHTRHYHEWFYRQLLSR
jgi:hypothetical protein